jgi:hypothetical protein
VHFERLLREVVDVVMFVGFCGWLVFVGFLGAWFLRWIKRN